jgi:hypothetical protein
MVVEACVGQVLAIQKIQHEDWMVVLQMDLL